jgi:hypothetical protein
MINPAGLLRLAREGDGNDRYCCYRRSLVVIHGGSRHGFLYVMVKIRGRDCFAPFRGHVTTGTVKYYESVKAVILI